MHANLKLGWASSCMVIISSTRGDFFPWDDSLRVSTNQHVDVNNIQSKNAQLNSFRTTLAALLNTEALEEIHYFVRKSAWFPFSRPETTSSISVPFMMYLMANTCWRNTFPIHYIVLSCIMVWCWPFSLQSARPLVVFCSCFPSPTSVIALSRLGPIRFSW